MSAKESMLLNCCVGEDSWVSWTARRSNQSILKEIKLDYSLKGLMLKLQYFGHLMQRADSLEKTLILGKIEGKRRRGQQKMKWLDSITDLVDMNLSKLRDMVKDREARWVAIHGIANSMLLRCCTQYARKFGKLSIGHTTGKVQFSFQSQRRKMPKNAQTTVQWYTFQMLAR